MIICDIACVIIYNFAWCVGKDIPNTECVRGEKERRREERGREGAASFFSFGATYAIETFLFTH